MVQHPNQTTARARTADISATPIYNTPMARSIAKFSIGNKRRRCCLSRPVHITASRPRYVRIHGHGAAQPEYTPAPTPDRSSTAITKGAQMRDCGLQRSQHRGQSPTASDSSIQGNRGRRYDHDQSKKILKAMLDNTVLNPSQFLCLTFFSFTSFRPSLRRHDPSFDASGGCFICGFTSFTRTGLHLARADSRLAHDEAYGSVRRGEGQARASIGH